MAIAVIGDLPGGNADLDQEMLGRLGLSDSPPPGALARLAGPIEGGWRVMSIWESQDQWDAFRRERLEPMFQGAGRDMPSFQIWPLHSYMFQPGR